MFAYGFILTMFICYCNFSNPVNQKTNQKKTNNDNNVELLCKVVLFSKLINGKAGFNQLK